MMRDPLALLDYECRRQPALARLAAGVADLSEADLQAADLLPWLREALRCLKAKRHQDALAATVAEWAVDGQVADPEGVTRQWTGGETYIRVGRTELLMKTGQLLWLDRHGVWIDTIHTTHIDPKLHTHTVFHARMTRTDYITTLRIAAQMSRCSTEAVSSSSSSSTELFRIFRPS